jgi:hypothetical protein
MRNRRKAYFPMRVRRSLSVNAAENVVLTDGFLRVKTFDAHGRFISKITLNRAGTSVLIENIRKFPGFPPSQADDSPLQLHWEGGI